MPENLSGAEFYPVFKDCLLPSLNSPVQYESSQTKHASVNCLSFSVSSQDNKIILLNAFITVTCSTKV